MVSIEYARKDSKWSIYTYSLIGVLFRSNSEHLKRFILDLFFKSTMQRLPARSKSFSTYFGGEGTYLVRFLIIV